MIPNLDICLAKVSMRRPRALRRLLAPLLCSLPSENGRYERKAGHGACDEQRPLGKIGVIEGVRVRAL
uniref:Uncharacterized protein n=1 Tax=Steinernema glaseri TaxID=37863 RepID=A0A1I7Y8Y5_9BILA